MKYIPFRKYIAFTNQFFIFSTPPPKHKMRICAFVVSARLRVVRSSGVGYNDASSSSSLPFKLFQPRCNSSRVSSSSSSMRHRRSNTSRARLTSSPTTNTKGAVLFLSFVPLSPSTSAAGVRTRDLLEGFIKAGYTDIHYVCAAKVDERENATLNKQLVEKGVRFYGNAIPNREEDFKSVLEECRKINPIDVVVFDRFLAEEAYSFRVKEVCENALRVLDMQDCHALRRERARIVNGESGNNVIEKAINAKPEALDDDFAREISSIFRSDLTLVCSSAEMEMLHVVCGVPKEKLCLAPFFETIDKNSIIKPYADRKDTFVSIGTFNHAPNVDGLRYLKKEIWPLIRAKLPNAEFHAYGATCLPKYIDELNDVKSGFIVKGFCENICEALGTAKILLAPLRFGAGIKGKVIEAFKYGTPVITTPIGGEGT